MSVHLLHHVGANLDDVVRPNPKHCTIECSVMNGAHAYSVGHDGFATIPIFLDVSGVEKRRVAEPTERALTRVGGQYAVAEHRLM